MADSTEQSALEKLADILLAHGVEFIVVGGQAEVLLGSPRVTYDVDLCYRRTQDNLERLAEALRQLDVGLRGAPPDLPFQLDGRALALGSNFALTTKLGDLDLLGYLEPLGDYDAVARHAETYQVGNLELKVISLEDLITIKRHIGRPKDRESLLHLLAIGRVRE